MECTIFININGEKKPLELKLDSASDGFITNEELLEALKGDLKSFEALVSLLSNKLYRNDLLKRVTVDTIRKEGGVVPNCTLKYLRDKFPLAGIPEGIEADILLGNIRIGRTSLHGRIVNSKGKEIFVISNEEDMTKVAEYFKNRKSIEELLFRYSKDSEEYSKLMELVTITGKKNIADLLLDVLNNKSAYKDVRFKSGKNAYPFLDKVKRDILKYTELDLFENETIQIINSTKDFNPGKELFQLNIEFLGKIFLQYNPEILAKLGIQTLEDFKKMMSSEDEVIKFLEKQGINVSAKEYYRTMFEALFLLEPTCKLRYAGHDSKNVYFESGNKSLKERYGIGYDTVSTFDQLEKPYRGYNIYKHNIGTEENPKIVYYINRGTITEGSISQRFDSEALAKKGIDELIKSLGIRYHSLIEFKFRTKNRDGYNSELDEFIVESKTYIPEETIVSIIDIPVNKDTSIFYDAENEIKMNGKYTINAFRTLVLLYGFSDEIKKEIIETIDTPEKVMTFIYKINEILKADRRNNEKALEVLDLFKDPPTKEYYIVDVSKKDVRGKGKMYSYKVIPTPSIAITEYKLNKRAPVVHLLNSIASVLTRDFKVPVEIITPDEIKAKFNDVTMQSAKAFIRDGVIYINLANAQADDLLHEYTHLFLGLLKANPDLRKNYEQLMYVFSETTDGKNLIRKLGNTYEGISKIDLAEEAFCILFGEYIMKTKSPESVKIFETYKGVLKQASDLIFGKDTPEISDLFKGPATNMFARFNNDIADLMSLGSIDFGVTKTSRRISNFINEKIRKDEIKLDCYEGL